MDGRLGELTWGDMGHGPRDWNPPGYWDAPAANTITRPRSRYVATQPRARSSNLTGLLAVALGLFATLLPLAHPDVSTGFRGFAFTTAGSTDTASSSRRPRYDAADHDATFSRRNPCSDANGSRHDLVRPQESKDAWATMAD